VVDVNYLAEENVTCMTFKKSVHNFSIYLRLSTGVLHEVIL